MATQTYEITLQDILDARERRAEKQKSIIKAYSVPLISFTVNMPGKYKHTPLSCQVFEEGMWILEEGLAVKGVDPLYKEVLYQITGPEAYIALDYPEFELKKMLVVIEDNHPIGRLFDFDVIRSDFKSISRVQVDKPVRKCLICNEDANICCRSRRHPVEELISRMQIMADEYFRSGGKPILY